VATRGARAGAADAGGAFRADQADSRFSRRPSPRRLSGRTERGAGIRSAGVNFFTAGLVAKRMQLLREVGPIASGLSIRPMRRTISRLAKQAQQVIVAAVKSTRICEYRA
jgi:hypothetical protein